MSKQEERRKYISLFHLGVRDLGYRLCFLGTKVDLLNASDETEKTEEASGHQDPVGASSSSSRSSSDASL